MENSKAAWKKATKCKKQVMEKSIFFFLEELKTQKSPFEINWPLLLNDFWD